MAEVAPADIPAKIEEKGTEETTANGTTKELKEANGSSNKTQIEKPDFSKYKSGNTAGNKPSIFRQYRENSKNIKTNYNALPETDDPDEIRKQVEFYFSDSNLAYDDYMRGLVGGSENKSVPIKSIHTFKRMRRFQPYSAVVAALKESKSLDVVGDLEDEIRRKTPFTETKKDDVDEINDPTIPRSIYAKGFGEETSTTQFDIENLFAPYGPVNAVRLRRQVPSRVFKGSVFVEFETEELQKEFLALENKPKWNGKDLIIKSKAEYCDENLDLIKDGKLQPHQRQHYKQYISEDPSAFKANRDNGDRNFKSRGKDKNGRRYGGRDADDWKGRRDDFQKNRRGRHRSKRDRSDDESENEDESPQKSVSEQEPAKRVAERNEESGASSGKKREREEDGIEGEESVAKKPKEDDVVKV